LAPLGGLRTEALRRLSREVRTELAALMCSSMTLEARSAEDLSWSSSAGITGAPRGLGGAEPPSTVITSRSPPPLSLSSLRSPSS